MIDCTILAMLTDQERTQDEHPDLRRSAAFRIDRVC
jgi:hypothetical protein